MTAGLREGRVQELCESSYVMLKDSYNMVRELKGLVDRLHAGYLQQGRPVDYDTVSAIKLTTDRVYGEMERYLRPEVDLDSADDAARTENP